MLAFKLLLMLALRGMVSSVIVGPAVPDVSAVPLLLPESHAAMTAPIRCQLTLLSSLALVTSLLLFCVFVFPGVPPVASVTSVRVLATEYI